MGHYAWESYDATNGVKEKAILVSDNQEIEETTFLLQIKEDKGDNLWSLDNGASNHMCGYKDKFVELDEKVKATISFGKNSH